jgi:hypothetical protein
VAAYVITEPAANPTIAPVHAGCLSTHDRVSGAGAAPGAGACRVFEALSERGAHVVLVSDARRSGPMFDASRVAFGCGAVLPVSPALTMEL